MTETSPAPPDPPRDTCSVAAAAQARGATLLITHATKIAGIVVAVNEAVVRGELRPLAMFIAAFMLAGAQVSEGFALTIIDRLFGKPLQQ